MQKLFDVSCNYHIDGGRGTSIFKGGCILDEDGWFEGIVKDSTEIYDGDSFVFGAYVPGKTIELYKLGPITITNPIVFHGDKARTEYIGDLEGIGLTGPIFSGETIIKTIENDYNKEAADMMQGYINAYKEKMDDTCALFYNRYLEIRKAYCEIFNRNAEGRGFTDSEVFELTQVLGPMNQKVINDTMDELTGSSR